MTTTRNGLVGSAIRSTESNGTTSTPSRRSTPSPRGQSSSRSARVALEHDQEPAERVDDDRDRHGGGRCPDRDRRSFPAAAASADDAGGEPLERGDATLGGLAAPDGLGSDDLRRRARGDADERPADQRGEDDDGRRCRVPAARAELDDDALGRGRRDDERNRHRHRRLERCAGDGHPERPSRPPRRAESRSRRAYRGTGRQRLEPDGVERPGPVPAVPQLDLSRLSSSNVSDVRGRYPPIRGSCLSRTPVYARLERL